MIASVPRGGETTTTITTATIAAFAIDAHCRRRRDVGSVLGAFGQPVVCERTSKVSRGRVNHPTHNLHGKRDVHKVQM